MPVRANTHVIAIDEEILGTDTFGTRNTGFDSDKQRFMAFDFTTNLNEQSLEQSGTRQDLGKHERIKGLFHPESELSVSTYLQGLGTAAGDGVTPTITNGQIYATSAVFGHKPVAAADATSTVCDGSNVAVGSPTATVFDQETETNVFGNDTVVGVDLSTGLECRPIASWSADTITLAIALSAAPVATDILYGSANVQWRDNDNTTRPFMQAETIGLDDEDSREFYGCAGSLVFPETPAAETQAAQFTFRAASGLYPTSTTQTSPTAIRPVVQAGGQFLVAEAGSAKTGINADWCRANVNLTNTWAGQDAINTTIGLSQWVLTDTDGTIEMTFAHDFDLTSLALPGGSTTWRDAFIAGGTDNNFQLFYQWGTTAGNIVTFYAKAVRVAMYPEMVDVDGIAAIKVTFEPQHGTTNRFVTSFL
jgi:hypothetical protein